MMDDEMTRDDAQAIGRALDPGSIPAHVQERLERTYASFGKIPQDALPMRARRRMGRGAMAVAVAATCALFAGVAYAATNMIQMQAGEGAFFASGQNLPVFDSMEPGAKALSAQVGQTASIGGVQMTLDEVSCDRSVANLYLTLHADDGFDMESLSSYTGSTEDEWAKVQNAIPTLGFAITGNDGVTSEGTVRSMDAYLEGGDIKCMMRVVPETVMAEQVQLDIKAWDQESASLDQAFSVGMDLADVPKPRELAAQEIAFDTVQGTKVLDLERFTSSELACVMVVGAQGGDGQEASADALDPSCLKVTDERGSVLHPVEAGDGLGVSEAEPRIIEFAGLSSDASSVTLTPVLADEEAMESDRQARVRALEESGSVPDDALHVDVSQVGAKIPLTELGGYEIARWEVEGSTVRISLAPYGWVPAGSVPELIPDGEVTMLAEEWTDPDTGQTGMGEHSAIRYVKWDYATGMAVQMDHYYKASSEELSALVSYRVHTYPAGWYAEDAAAAQTFPLA